MLYLLPQRVKDSPVEVPAAAVPLGEHDVGGGSIGHKEANGDGVASSGGRGLPGTGRPPHT